MNKAQIIGIGIIAIAMIVNLLTDNYLIHTITGVLCAIGLGFLFKWLSFRKETLKE
jgi:hypothetical protein